MFPISSSSFSFVCSTQFKLYRFYSFWIFIHIANSQTLTQAYTEKALRQQQQQQIFQSHEDYGTFWKLLYLSFISRRQLIFSFVLFFSFLL